jgi:hypothetical protein
MSDSKAAWIGVVGAVAAALIGAFAVMSQRPAPVVPGSDASSTTTSGNGTGSGADSLPTEPVMGQLEVGINRQGLDFSAQATTAPNPETCAESCRTNDACKAMTYVISLQTCWLKKGVPNPFPPGGADYVSAIKR